RARAAEDRRRVARPCAVRALERLDRLRVDVDDGREPGATHGNSGGGEELRGTPSERARPIGFADELRTVASAQPEQRCRAEQLGIAEPVAELLERTQRVRLLRPADDDPYEVRE